MKRPSHEPTGRSSQRNPARRPGGATRADSTQRRRRIGRFEVLDASRWLTNRDKEICKDVFDHRVLTSNQLLYLHFTHQRVAERRLKQLWERCVLNRYQPPSQKGSEPFHYILGDLGTHILAGIRCLDVRTVKDRIKEDAVLQYKATFRHRMAVNDFFSTLAWASRHSKEQEPLSMWWNEPRCAAEWDGLVRPDGLGRLRSSTGSCTFFLELDRGTERGGRLAEKLDSYAWFSRVEQSSAGRDDVVGVDAVLFLFPTLERELRARAKLHRIPGLGVATATDDLFYQSPLGQVWLPIDGDERMRLPSLPT